MSSFQSHGARLACALLSGVLIFLSFPPADLWPLAFVALGPLMVATCGSRSWRGAALLGLTAGLVGYLPSLAWLASVTVPGWVALALYVSFYAAVAALAFRLFQRRAGVLWPLPAAAAWVGLEFVRAWLITGFPWLFMGYTQYRWLSLVQLSTVTGVYGVSFVVVLTSAALAQVAIEKARSGRGGRFRFSTRDAAMLAGPLALLAACLIGGATARRSVRLRPGPVVGVVQQNIPRLVSDLTDKSYEQFCRDAMEELKKVQELSESLEGTGMRLLVWPETTVQAPMNVSPSIIADPWQHRILLLSLDMLKGLGQRMGCYFLIGARSWFKLAEGYVEDTYDTEVADFGNSALMFSPEVRFMGRYDKMHLVPFGEYIPLRDVLPLVGHLTPFQRGLTPGDEAVIFELPAAFEGAVPTRFAALICYEDVMPALVRQFTRSGADFLVNLTDEGWYRIPGELRQHMAMAVFRAVENRTTVVRAANTGISCFIDPTGRIYECVSRQVGGRSRVRNVAGVASAPVRLCDATTFYVKHGDVFAAACLALSVGAAVLLICATACLSSRARR